MHLNLWRRCASLTVWLFLLNIGFVGGAKGQSTPVPPTATDNAALGDILGSNAAGWKLTQPGTLEKLDGRPVLSSGKQPMTLSGSDKFSVDMEYQLVVRLHPPAGAAAASVFFQIGLKDPADATPNPSGAELSGLPGANAAAWQVSDGSKDWKSSGGYLLKAVTTPSLAWPEALRRSVEADMAKLPDLNHKWLTLRYVVRKNSIETYLDDRLLDVRTENNLAAAGSVRLVLSPDVSIASLRVKPLPPEDPLFRPVALGGFLNDSLLNGQPIDRSTLPPPDKPALVGGVPFLFPQPDSVGNDHISLAGSWVQFGNLETYVESYAGDFGGRWPTALTVNPARIEVRVPNDHYTRMYLIAAASNEPNTTPVITAQFFKAWSGYPKSFAAKVPLFTAQPSAVTKLPSKLRDGTAGSLYLVTIDLDPGQLAELGRVDPTELDTDWMSSTAPHVWKGNLHILDLELTKEVEPYRNYPDPNCHSVHQAGLPSSVHIYALTMERSPVRLAFEPDKFGNVWTAPAVPSYTVTLGNHTAAPRAVELALSTRSHDGSEKTEQKQSVTVPPGDGDTLVKFAVGDLKQNGYHEVTLTMKDGPQVWTEKRSLARLPVDTRERGNWEEGKGPLMGYWAWGGAHDTPDQLEELQVMTEAGAETRNTAFDSASTPPDAMAFAQAHQFVNVFRFNSAVLFDTAFSDPALKWDAGNRADASAALLARLKTREIQPGPIVPGNLVPFFPEPSVGGSTFINQPEYWGEPPYTLTDDEKKSFLTWRDKFVVGARIIRQNWPKTKILLGYSDPCFCIPFLRDSEEVRQLIDGVCLDMPAFDRLPESQLHQVVHQRLYEMLQEFHKYGKKPVLATGEATFVPTFPDGLTWNEQADIHTRNLLIYFAYGAYQQASTAYPFDCAGYWGEEQYGAAGLFHRLPNVTPKPSYVAYATLTRHLNRANFEKWLPTGSGSTYALQFKHSKTGKLIHVLWTVRGKRSVTLDVPPGDQVMVYDQDDNTLPLTETEGKATFTIDSSPCYVEGLTGDATISLGTPDQSDSQPAPDAIKLSNLGDATWKLSRQRDLIYENNDALQIARFPGKMSVVPTAAPAEQGGKALAVHLEKQDKERQLMPWYTSLVPNYPMVIPGKAGHLGLWVHASSDWGRVVYCLRDAKQQRWISIGTKDSWNCDDTRQLSSFCFDGWRYLRFELPSNAPYDNFREQGSTWWGHYGPGEGTVHLPLTLEKIIVERRTHTLYVNDPQPAKPDDVLLGDLMAEYAAPFNKTDAVIVQSRVTMPAPAGTSGLANPIKESAATGVGTPVAITRIDPPAQDYDGTRCLVFFDPAPAAATYNVWVAPYSDGSGAVQLGTGWKQAGQLITGLRPEIEFYAFVTYTDKDGKLSKPSRPFKFALKDMFPMK